MTLAQAVRKSFLRPSFVAALLIMATAAVGLNAAVGYLQLHFKKQAVPLRQSLEMIPDRIGPWVNVSAKEALDPEMEDVLGTKQYIFRDYVDSRVVAEETIASFNDKSTVERMQKLAEIQLKNPAAVVRAAVTYYTGLVDTVAHIPDRCYVADGFEPTTYEDTKWTVLSARPGDGHIRFINFEDKTPSRQAVSRNVAYFFNCNGDYVSDPLLVRQRLQNLQERYGYYAKIELLTVMPDTAASHAVMSDFLTSALPKIEQCLPDWRQVKAMESKPAAAAASASADTAQHAAR